MANPEKTLLRIPKAFYDDHVDRELPAPAIVRRNKLYYYIDADDPHIGELRSDAMHYANDGLDDAGQWVVDAARRLLKSLSQQSSQRRA